MTRFTTAATVIFFDAFGNGLHLALLAIRAAEFKTTDLERHYTVAKLD